MVGLRSGRTGFIVPRAAATSANALAPPARQEEWSGIIYTDHADMPSLEELLRQHDVAVAVLERPVPEPLLPPAPAPPSGGRARRDRGSRTLRAVLAAVLGTAIATVGWTLFAHAVGGETVEANPYTALSLGLGGVVLIASLLMRLRERPERETDGR